MLIRSIIGCPLLETSTVHPVAEAAASKQACTLAINSSRRVSVAARTYHSDRVYDGMMLGASPPWVIMQCTLSVGYMAWRSVAVLT